MYIWNNDKGMALAFVIEICSTREATMIRVLQERRILAKKRETRSQRTAAGFYIRALSEAERLQMDDAFQVEGIDDEIALLRIRLRDLVEQSPDRIDLQVDLANVIARLVRTRYQISSEQKRSLKAAITKVLEEVAVPLGIGLGVGVGGTLKR